MIFTTSFVLSALPFLALAAPVAEVPSAAPVAARGMVTIPLSKRGNGLMRRDVSEPADIDFLRGHKSFIMHKINRGSKRLARHKKKKHHSSAAGSATSSASIGTSTVIPPSNLVAPGEGEDDLIDQASQLWSGTVMVGTPPVAYTVDFDTGSSDLFLPGPNCDENCDGHQVYDPSQSSTSQDVGQKYTLGFGDGSSVKGEQFTDTVSIAGLSATNQAVGASTQYSTGFAIDQFQPDGLMGMGFQSISEFNAPPLFQTLVSQNQTQKPVFAFKLSAAGAQLTVGGTNDTLKSGDFTFVPVTEQGFWQVNMDAVSVNGQQAVGKQAAIIDTGTTLMVGDSKTVKEFYKAIPGSKDASDSVGSGFFTVPCDSIPTMALTFGGKSFSVDPTLFNQGPVDDGSSECVGGLSSGDVGSSGWIIGDMFLQNVYTVFDFGNTQVGFANLANTTSS